MNINLFKLALERLQPSDWEEFERLASDFLVTEFIELRTMAYPARGEGWGEGWDVGSKATFPVVN